MTDSSSSSPFRYGPAVALLLLGFGIAVVAGDRSPGPRLQRRERLVDLIANEDARTRRLRAQLDRLQGQIENLQRGGEARERRLAAVRGDLDRLGALAGLTPASGPGVRIELRDSTLRESPSGDPNDLVIHEQDLQAVVNALWAAGAEAMAINGERITAASAVRCVGNTLLLHGSVYAPPYRIDALGDPATVLDRMNRDPQVERFRIFAEEFRLGFDARPAEALTLPAFRGVLGVDEARRQSS